MKNLNKLRFLKSLILVIASTFLSSCFIDSNAEKQLNLNSNVDQGLKISSLQKIKLAFNKPLAIDSVNKTSVILKNSNNKILDASNYTINYDDNKLQIGLSNPNLKSQTGHYLLILKDITDVYGKKLEYKEIKIEFIDSEPPYLVNYNLGNASKINANFSLNMNFSEPLKLSSDFKDNFILLDSANYKNIDKQDYKISASNSNKRFKLALTNSSKKQNSGTYKLIFKDISDAEGNKLNDPGIEFQFLSSNSAKLISTNLAGEFLPDTTHKIVLKFDKVLDESSLKNLSFKIQKGNNSDEYSKIENNQFSLELSSDKKQLYISKNNEASQADFLDKLYYFIDFSKLKDENWNEISGINSVKFKVLKSSEIVFVKSDGTASADGKSWSNAKTLEQALNSVSGTQTIFVASGTYEAPISGFAIKEGTKIYGGFTPEEPDNPRDLQGSVLNNLTVDKTIVKVERSSSTRLDKSQTVFDAFVVEGGKINSNSEPKFNGSIQEAAKFLVDRVNMTINNLTYRNNEGRLTIITDQDAGNVDIKNSFFEKNKKSALRIVEPNTSSAPKNQQNINIINCLFEENTDADRGGAITNSNRRIKLNIKNSKFKGNRANEFGGAISIHNSVYENDAIKIENSIFIDNSITEFKCNNNICNKGNGGALSIITSSNANAEIENSLFIKNNSKSGGAIYFNSAKSELKILNSVFYENLAESDGGAISFGKENSNNSSYKIINSNFINNLAIKNGGAVYFEDCIKEGSFYNSVFWNNKHNRKTEMNDMYARCHIDTFKDTNTIKHSVLTNVLNIDPSKIKLEKYNIDETIGEGNANNKIGDPKISVFLEEIEQGFKNNFDAQQILKSDFMVLEKGSIAKNLASKDLYLSYFNSSSINLENETDIAGNPRLSNNQMDAGAIQTSQQD